MKPLSPITVYIQTPNGRSSFQLTEQRNRLFALEEKKYQYCFSKEELTELLAKTWDAEGTEHETSKGKMFEQFINNILNQ